MDELRKIPPFTRYTIFGVLGATLPTLLHLVSPYHLAFVPHRIAQNWELQRLVLPFLFGGGGLNLVFSLIMLYRSLNELEEGHFQRRLADMTWAFILICGMIIGLNTPLQTPFLFNPFMMAVIHLWAQTHSANQVNLYGIITIPAPYFPFAMLGMDLLNGGPSAVLRSFTGMVAAHAYYFLSVIYPRQNGGRQPALVRSLLTPPQTLINLLGNGPLVPSSYAAPGSSTGGSGSYRLGGGTAYRPADGAAGAAARARTTTGGAPAGGSSTATREQQAQHRWGRGTRLGGE
ncbi:hypothetical protein NBRC10512_007683 [Rhodotorula toruloides]|uniref:Derlin n=2 Tax=Rhodotorula toruloides TaxID=5286 RepID=A0A061ARQ6_RHOTO|nr:Derl-like domain member 2 [Rhodotorula toruloides NP11]EMS20727.1 Derl-like domain member 2 [Rhodotorula toruloides NP11]KAJ8294385.1 Derlin-2 [Rhodotorula toruloides]CDR40255.1 RHTO0S05e00298g1_1 [Rhodotorula toruloides]